MTQIGHAPKYGLEKVDIWNDHCGIDFPLKIRLKMAIIINLNTQLS